MPAGAEVTYPVRCGRGGNDTVTVRSAPRRAKAPLLVSGVRWLIVRDQSSDNERTFRCGSAPMGKIEVSIISNHVKSRTPAVGVPNPRPRRLSPRFVAEVLDDVLPRLR